jgi:SWI/SNF-related matrix-associated actin-dependent regulator of chromatin subfamily A containing DEAD/H box 1
VFGHNNRELLVEALTWSTANLHDTTGTQKQQRGDLSLAQLRKMLAPFVLRRLKKHVLDQLVDKVTIVKQLSMTPFQQEVYDNILLGHAARQIAYKEAAEAARASELSSHGLSAAAKGGSSRGSLKQSSSSNSVVDLSSPQVELAADAPNDVDAIVAPLAAMSHSEANNLFTALRKAANHPLLLRVRYKDPSVLEKIAMVAYAEQHFGNQCDYQRVRDELDLMSDYDLHLMCLMYTPLNNLQLDASVLYDSPKMEWMRTMLPKLQVYFHFSLLLSRSVFLLGMLCIFFHIIFSPKAIAFLFSASGRDCWIC